MKDGSIPRGCGAGAMPRAFPGLPSLASPRGRPSRRSQAVTAAYRSSTSPPSRRRAAGLAEGTPTTLLAVSTTRAARIPAFPGEVHEFIPTVFGWYRHVDGTARTVSYTHLTL